MSILLVILSVVILSACAFYLYKNTGKSNETSSNWEKVWMSRMK